MAAEETMTTGETRKISAESIVIRVESGDSTVRTVGRRVLAGILVASIFMNFMFLISTVAENASRTTGNVQSKHLSGKTSAGSKLAVINFSGTIMPPYTERWIRQIKAAAEDDAVKGVLLAVDSPGGLVADSHQIYHELLKLRKRKPLYVAMKRLAASGGYYLAMGIGTEGRIFAEPTTWTGSIGVIIPRYNASDLAKQVGIRVEPLATGPLKDSLNPFRDLSEQETEVWDSILNESFDRFVGLISENRPNLNEQQVRDLATGQIYTANQALENGLIDEIGYQEDALKALAASLNLTDYEAIEYSSPQTLVDVLLGSKAQPSTDFTEALMDAAVPKAMYYCSWNPWVPANGASH